MLAALPHDVATRRAAEAIALARTLYGDAAVTRLAIVGSAIERPATHAIGLSPAVAAAVGLAAALVADPHTSDPLDALGSSGGSVR